LTTDPLKDYQMVCRHILRTILLFSVSMSIFFMTRSNQSSLSIIPIVLLVMSISSSLAMCPVVPRRELAYSFKRSTLIFVCLIAVFLGAIAGFMIGDEYMFRFGYGFAESVFVGSLGGLLPISFALLSFIYSWKTLARTAPER